MYRLEYWDKLDRAWYSISHSDSLDTIMDRFNYYKTDDIYKLRHLRVLKVLDRYTPECYEKRGEKI